ncbi:MAG: DUF4129 domain-containing protein [Prevotella sp.]|nr:DUF4129 domain-containing protein [Prevotella sp.]
MTLDTLACDSAQIVALQQNPAYNYNRELMAREETLWEWLKMQIAEWWHSLMYDGGVSGALRDMILVIIGVCVVGLIGWFLYKYRPELFMRKRLIHNDEDEEEETIYGIDFDREISRAAESGNYRQAVRYLYLKTLRHLSDTGKIDWQPSKTPTQYLREAPSEAFRTLTSHFLRVRYGNFTATRQLFEEVRQLCQEGGWQ